MNISSTHTHGSGTDENKSILPGRNWMFLIIIFFVLGSWQHLHAKELHSVTVYKSPTCGCCNKWVKHLEKNGFTVNAINSHQMEQIKNNHGVPIKARSCHTALINDYVIEGHVPAADIKKLIAEKRAVAGLAVPGMVMGSPGMEGPRSDHYAVYEFDKVGRSRIVSKY